jgi:hypothetical protein
MGGSSKAPQTPSPQDSAKAEALSQLAGSEFNLGTAPIQAYAEALNQIQLDPTFQKIQNADQANSALGTAQATSAVNADVNPYGSAGQNAFNRSASQRLGNVSGQPYTPGLTPTNDSQAFQYPSAGNLPNFNSIVGQAKALTSAFPQVNIGKNTVGLSYPNNTPQIPTGTFLQGSGA